MHSQRQQGPPYVTYLPNSSTSNSGPIGRSHLNRLVGQVALRGGSLTLYEAFGRSRKLFAQKACLGDRSMDSHKNLGPFMFRSYLKIDEAVTNVASGLVKEQLVLPVDNQASNSGSKLKLLGIYMKNCSAWIVAEYACYSLSVATVPFYDTLGADTVEFIINQTMLQTIVCSPIELPKLCSVASKCPSLKTLIVVALMLSKEELAMCQAAALRVMTFVELQKIGQAYPARPVPPSPSDLATFCYTSGTTGNPKGALLTHANLVAVSSSGLSACFDVQPSDFYLSFLPLPHIFERIVISSLLASGASVGFSQGDPLKIVEDLVSLKPTIMCAVPRLLNRIFDKINQGVDSATGIKGVLIRKAFSDKLTNLRTQGQVAHWLWDRLFFSKIKEALGMERVRRLISGGAPLPPATMDFFRILLGAGASVHEGYGQTETTGGTTITFDEDLSSGSCGGGHVGGPLPVCDVKLVDVPEMGYLHTDTLHDTKRCDGRGEVWVRGPGVFAGYYDDPAATAEALTPDGWLRTGDIAMWTPSGQLAIIDRKKNLLKLSQGEYVALEKVENLLGRAPLIAQIFVHGESEQDYLVAVVVPETEAVEKLLRNGSSSSSSGSGGSGGSSSSFGNNESSSSGGGEYSELVYQAIMSEIAEASKEGQLKGFEIVRKIHIDATGELWTSANGMMTPTMKLKRSELKKRYKRELEDLYKTKPSSRL